MLLPPQHQLRVQKNLCCCRKWMVSRFQGQTINPGHHKILAWRKNSSPLRGLIPGHLCSYPLKRSVSPPHSYPHTLTTLRRGHFLMCIWAEDWGDTGGVMSSQLHPPCPPYQDHLGWPQIPRSVVVIAFVIYYVYFTSNGRNVNQTSWDPRYWNSREQWYQP